MRRTLEISFACCLAAALLLGSPNRLHKLSATTASGTAPATADGVTLDPEHCVIAPASVPDSLFEAVRIAEYNITWQDKSVIDGDPGGLHAANRANNIRAYFRTDGVQIFERETADPDWDLRWQFMSWGRETIQRPAREIEPAAKQGSNKVVYSRPAIGKWFIAGPRFIEQEFTLYEKSAGEGNVLLIGEMTGNVTSDQARESCQISFKSTNGKIELRQLSGKFTPVF